MNKLYNGLCLLLFSMALSTDCIVINEIHYNPDIDQNQADEDYEFVELYNKCDDAVDISDWSLYRHDNCWGCYYDEIYQFNNNTHIDAYDYIVLAHNNDYYEGSLDWGDEFLPNYGTELILVDSSCNGYNIKDYVSYDDQHPWPTDPDGQGASLELLNANFDNEDGASWQASLGCCPRRPLSLLQSLKVPVTCWCFSQATMMDMTLRYDQLKPHS